MPQLHSVNQKNTEIAIFWEDEGRFQDELAGGA